MTVKIKGGNGRASMKKNPELFMCDCEKPAKYYDLGACCEDCYRKQRMMYSDPDWNRMMHSGTKDWHKV